MKNKFCILLAFISIISIGVIVYYSNFVYLNAYNTVLFWGMNLYVLTASCLMLANQKDFPMMTVINIGITCFAIYWFIHFLPKYNPADALEHARNNAPLVGYTYTLDHQKPVQPITPDNFIKGVYRIHAFGPEDYVIYVHPETGAFELLPLKNDINKYAFTLVENKSELDENFSEAWSAAKNNPEALSAALIQYTALWKKEMKRQLNLLLSCCDKDNKELLLKEQSDWENYFISHQNMQLQLFEQKYSEGSMMQILKDDIPYQLYRQRALKLQSIYKKLNKEASD